MAELLAADPKMPSDGGPCENTDRHLWPDTSDPNAVHESIHVTAQGGIGINVGGFIYVKSLREWHKLAGGPWSIRDEEAKTSKERNVCQFDPLVYGTIQAGFHRYSLGGDPVLTITDQEAVGEPEVCLDMLEARALRDWLNGVLGAPETPAPHDVTCNYRGQPLFSPGCICKVVNKHEYEQLAAQSDSAQLPPPELQYMVQNAPPGFVLVTQCAGCGVHDVQGARHWSQCPAYPGELVRPALKTSDDPCQK